jgi:type III restriction enzyme
MATLFDPTTQAREAGAAAVDEPIINRPYDEPVYHWRIVTDWAKAEQAAPEKVEGRREAGYFFSPRTGRGAQSILEQEFVPLDCVNEIRRRVRQWREEGYRGVSPVTRKLLEHWRDEDHVPRLFFCQREAAETIIWLHEAHPADRQGLVTQLPNGEGVVPLEEAHEAFRRVCCKMATGTGKTVVMAMLIAWSALNKLHSPQETWCSDAVLLVAPGITIRDRLRVLRPEEPGNYYDMFDLVPASLRSSLGAARVCIIHRQEMAIKDDTRTRGVQKLGPESDRAFANRLLRQDLGSKQRLLVFNDEGHHCYRPIETEEQRLRREERDENERAAQWITGLEKIHAARGILTCIDFSATPFYLQGSGYPEGRPFPWIVSDFGLVDAIESGLVKIPQIPVDDNHGDAKTPPAYFHLWRWVNEQLPAEDRETVRRKAKADAVVRQAEPALVTVIGNWKKEFEEWQRAGSPVPPVMIVVSQDTSVSREVYERLTRADFEFDDFVNAPGREVTYLYDTKELSKAEEGENVKDAEQRKREVMNTVGKEGQAGEQVRCISSVSMLTEGWDANNVTQVVGLRAFTSPLLCEQAVGRALRRRSYDVEENGFLRPEYADVYGVPFQVIPVKAKKGVTVTQPSVSTLVQALKERQAEFEITFPRVEGYVPEIREHVACAWDQVPRIRIGADQEPTEVWVKGVSAFRIGRPDIGGPGALERHDRLPYYLLSRVQSATFRMAAELVRRHVPGQEQADAARRKRLFAQFVEIVRRYVGEYVEFEQAPAEEIGLAKWQEKILNVLAPYISEAGVEGEAVWHPRTERFRPEGSTREVFFRTARPCRETVKSHISHVVVDAARWENTAAYQLERRQVVQSYARNDHLDFTIPYVDGAGIPRMHRPDFIVRLVNGLHVALEVKGHVRELDELKMKAGHKWASAVNGCSDKRRWVYHACFSPRELANQLRMLC